VEPAPAPQSLRVNFAWTFVGNAVHAASQWMLLSLVAKLGDAHMLGEYALSFAIAMPAAMLSHMNLRAVLATDVERKHPFGDYLVVRAAASAAGLAAIAVVVFLSGYHGRLVAATLIIGFMMATESFSDLYHGLMQRRERMEQVARSMTVRGLMGVVALGATLYATRDLVWAVAALAASRVVMLLIYDRPLGERGETLGRSGRGAQLAILQSAIPLGAVLMLVSLTTNLPRYAIEQHLGTRELGAFAAVASAMTVGNTVVNAFGQAATPRLARLFSTRDLRAFRLLAGKLGLMALALGGLGALGAAVAGEWVLRIVYRPEYAAYASLLAVIMLVGTIVYTSIAFGYVLTAARLFGPQMPLLAVVAATCAAASYVLVPRIGLFGAAGAIAIAGSVQIAGQWIILSRLLRRKCE
jgi:O-antigen/teichoic acid export membrane protein